MADLAAQIAVLQQEIKSLREYITALEGDVHQWKNVSVVLWLELHNAKVELYQKIREVVELRAQVYSQGNELKQQGLQLKTQDQKLETQDQKLKTQDQKLKTQDQRLADLEEKLRYLMNKESTMESTKLHAEFASSWRGFMVGCVGYQWDDYAPHLTGERVNFPFTYWNEPFLAPYHNALKDVLRVFGFSPADWAASWAISTRRNDLSHISVQGRDIQKDVMSLQPATCTVADKHLMMWIFQLHSTYGIEQGCA